MGYVQIVYFAEIHKILLNSLCFSLLSYYLRQHVNLDVGIVETKFNLFQKEEK